MIVINYYCNHAYKKKSTNLPKGPMFVKFYFRRPCENITRKPLQISLNLCVPSPSALGTDSENILHTKKYTLHTRMF